MGRATGRADLPLHGGRVPKWLAERMARLGAVAVEALVLAYGRDEVLRRLAHPFWFQSLGCVMGMDWHSSGITTSVVGALQRGLAPLRDELGLEVCGGRGTRSRQTPGALMAAGERWALEGDVLAATSRRVAKVDSALVQDGFQIYLHAFVVAADGKWAVVQQGMAPDRGLARRYHWLSEGLESFVDDPHAAIDGEPEGRIVNLADRRAERARAVSLGLIGEGPDRVLSALREARRAPAAESTPLLPHLIMPRHHDVRPENVVERRLHGALRAAAQAAPQRFEDLLAVPGLGARTLASLALIGEVIHGAPSRFSDPARFSLAHGGKDGHPFPVPLDVYDAALSVYRRAIERAKLGQDDRLSALRRLSSEAQRLESAARGRAEPSTARGRAEPSTARGRAELPTVAEYIEQERRDSWRYGGMTVEGPAQPPRGPVPRDRSSAGRRSRSTTTHRSRAARRQLSLPIL